MRRKIMNIFEWIKKKTGMGIEKSYEEKSIEKAKLLIQKGYESPSVLRELLICTTSKYTCPMVMDYFNTHIQNSELLDLLFSIALEGDDSGDAPWAAANVISEFSGELLAPYKNKLLELASYEWDYLRIPAEEALNKIEG
jgi:hypothetical protein